MQLQKYIQGLINSAIHVRVGIPIVPSKIDVIRIRTEMFEVKTQIINFVQCLSDSEKTKVQRHKFDTNNERLMRQASILLDKIEYLDKLII